MKLPELSPGFRKVLPFLLGGAACAGAFINYAASPAPENLLVRAAHGGSLLGGLPAEGMSFNMPLFSVLLAAAFKSGAGPAALAALVQPLLCALLFTAGRLAGGYAAGTAALAAAAVIELAGRPYDLEQSVYSAALLLAVCMLLRPARAAERGRDVSAGLALGISVLVRPPMLLFPFLPAAWAVFADRTRAGLRRAAVILVSSYVLLLPWGLMNLRMGGGFSPVNSESAADNVISGALGAVYTMEGDSLELAGLRSGESAMAFYAGRAVSDPAAWLAVIARRLLHIFLFHPFLFAVFLAALAFNRERALLPALSLPVYFTAVHAFFSIDPRYFQPMIYLLPPLAAGAAFRALKRGSVPFPETGGRVLRAIFYFFLASALTSGALALAYPYRSSSYLAGTAAAAGSPLDRTTRHRACEDAAASPDHAAALECFRRYAADFKDEGLACAVAAAEGRRRGGAVPERAEDAVLCLAARMFGALAEGDGPGADREMEKALGIYRESFTVLRGEPYARDRELAARIRGQERPFWRRFGRQALLLRPPGERPAIISAARARFSVPLGFGSDGRFSSTVPPGAAARAKKMSDEAVRLMGLGRIKAGGELIEKALAEHHSLPEALMGLCHFRSVTGRPLEAAEACGLAFCSVYAVPARHRPGLIDLAAEAASRRAGLLREAGRENEAAEFLRSYGDSVPEGWPRAARRDRAGGFFYTIPTGGRAPDPCGGLRFADEPAE